MLLFLRSLRVIQALLDSEPHFSVLQDMLNELFDSSYGCTVDLETAIAYECNTNLEIDGVSYDVAWTKGSHDIRISNFTAAVAEGS